MDGELYTRSWRRFRKALLFIAKTPPASSCSKKMTQSVSARESPLGLKSMDSTFFHGQLSLQILIPSSICRDYRVRMGQDRARGVSESN